MKYPDRYTCEEAFRRLDDYVDRELAPEEAARVEEHLRLCAVCAREFSFEESVLQHVRTRIGQLSVPEGLLARVSAALSAGREARE